MHSTSSTAFLAPSRGLIDSSTTWTLTKDGKRFRPSMMMTGLEGEVFGFVKDVLTAGATGGAGDVIAQLASQRTKEEQEVEEPFELDARRSLSYAGFAAGYTGAFQHFLFSNLQEAIPDPIVRVVINQGLIIPLCYYTLLVWLVPKLRAQTSAEEQELRESIDVVKMIPRNWAFWVPLQFVQFNFIPMEFQVIYCSFCGLIWNVCLSFLTAGGPNKETVPLPETAMLKMDYDVGITIPSPETSSSKPVLGKQSAKAPSIASKRAESDRSANRWLGLLNRSEDSTKEAVAEDTASKKARR